MFLGAAAILERILVSEAQARGLSSQGSSAGSRKEHPSLLSPSLTGDGGVAGRLRAQ